MSDDLHLKVMLGDEIRIEGERYVVTSIYGDGTVILTPIPDGMTVMDLGRKFFAAPVAMLQSYDRKEKPH